MNEYHFEMAMILEGDNQDAVGILFAHLKHADFDFWTEGPVQLVKCAEGED